MFQLSLSIANLLLKLHFLISQAYLTTLNFKKQSLSMQFLPLSMDPQINKGQILLDLLNIDLAML